MQIALDNVSYLEEIYEQYHKGKVTEVTEEWRQYFDYISKKECIVQTKENCEKNIKKQMSVLQLINAYRYMGHIKANIDPINGKNNVKALQFSLYELNKEDINKVFYTGVGKNKATLKEIIDVLDITYCRSIGCEFMHLINNEEKVWLEQSFESVRNNYSPTKKISLHVLELLTAAEGLENYLSSKYPGTKRFGIEGGETLIPMLSELIQRSGNYRIKEIFMGMAHRGRINVLVNILGKSPADIIKEFEGKQIYESGSGDVKYHQGFSSKIMTKGGEVHLKLAFNPSHLEIIYPVIEGAVRARQDYIKDKDMTKVLPIVIHGDTAFSGQGVVMETLQMSKIKEYNTGGTLHIIINNQIGFTTYRHNARSTKYCSDIAKMFQYPVFHVNGDDPEAVQYVTQLAVDYRNKFKKDVVIDIICYRRRGHHEADEPSITQPIMYKKIKNHPTTREIYSKYLLKKGLISKNEVKNMVCLYLHNLDYYTNKSYKKSSVIMYKFYDAEYDDTSFEMKRMHELAGKMCNLGIIEVQSKVAKIYEDRHKMVNSRGMNINWGFAEMLSYASLLDEGYAIRITGQDTGRGTFSHRHAVIHNQKDGSVWEPMQHIKKGQQNCTIVDSILSEEAVLAFEYGYSTTSQRMFVAWEAQFGDFANGAQVVIDQFISSGETKWGSLCGLTLLLPHGYEGQGPEHSSARIERFIQLCAEQNMQLCLPTNPSQLFHLIRSQVRRNKPLILMQPKSLLRHKYAKSRFEDLSYGSFKTVIGETENLDPDIVKRIILTSGKVYYDLFAYRKAHNINDTAILRIEQLYPFPEKSIIEKISSYSKCERIIWCQEEPKNQGAWYQIKYYLNKKLKLKFVGRTAGAAPASGYIDLHMKQQANLIKEAFL